MKKYKLLRDCPHGKAGSIWEMKYHGMVKHSLKQETDEIEYWFPVDTFDDWFEEIHEIKPFTKEQSEWIKQQLDTIWTNGAQEANFRILLNQNTEK